MNEASLFPIHPDLLKVLEEFSFYQYDESYVRFIGGGKSIRVTQDARGVRITKRDWSDAKADDAIITAPLEWHEEPFIFRGFLSHLLGLVPAPVGAVYPHMVYSALCDLGFEIGADGYYDETASGITPVASYSPLGAFTPGYAIGGPVRDIFGLGLTHRSGDILGVSDYWVHNLDFFEAAVSTLVPTYLESLTGPLGHTNINA